MPVGVRMVTLVLGADPAVAADGGELHAVGVQSSDADLIRGDLAVSDDEGAVRGGVVVAVETLTLSRRSLGAVAGLNVDTAEEAPLIGESAVVGDGRLVEPELVADCHAAFLLA